MQNLISVIADKCVGCGACMNICPAPEANRFKILPDGKKVVEVVDEKCIACGKCLTACPHDARDYEDDTDKFFKAISQKRVAMLVSPAIKTAFPDTWAEMLKWLKQEGVFAIYDLSLGGDICSWASLRAIEQNKMKYVVSSQCPAAVNYILTYKQEMLKDISPVYSPALCMAVYLHTYLKNNFAIAYFSPCVAAKTEFADGNLIEYNITFKRVEEYILRKKVNLKKAGDGVPFYNFDEEPGCLGEIMIRPGGLRDNIWAREPEVNISMASGKNAYDSILDFAGSPEHVHPVILDCMSCDKGCAAGPGMDEDVTTFVMQDVLHQCELDARSRRKTGIMNGPDKQYKKFDETFNMKSFMHEYKLNGTATNKIAEADLKVDYMKMGLVDDSMRKYNCGKCGNKTCREMAEKIHLGLEVPENCVVYASSMSGGDNSSAANKVGEMAQMAENVGAYANHLLADIENIYASLYNIDDANRLSQERSSIVRDILSKIVGFCSGCEYIDADNLPILISTLQKLQTAIESLNELIDDSAANSNTIREAMKEVADATTKLNVMVNEIADPTK